MWEYEDGWFHSLTYSSSLTPNVFLRMQIPLVTSLPNSEHWVHSLVPKWPLHLSHSNEQGKHMPLYK